MQMKGLQAVVIAGALTGCTSYTLTSVRPTYSEPQLRISCMALPNESEKINEMLSQLYQDGWRLAATGTKAGMGQQPFVCFEAPPKAPKAKAAPKPPPPAVEEESQVEEEEAVKPPPPPAKKAKKAPAVEEPEDNTEATPPPPPKPAKKPRKPALDE